MRSTEQETAELLDIAGYGGRRVSVTSEHLEALVSRLDGRMLRPGEEGWDEAVCIWNGMVARKPALVVQPATVRDVVAVVGFARDHELLLSIKGGGHNIAGTAIADGGLMLDVASMRNVTVDPDARLAHVGPGCLLQDVDRATQENGLATVLGDGAVGNRNARFAMGVNGMWEPDETQAEAFRHWIREAWTKLRQFSTGRTYINFQTADEGAERVRETYGANLTRLVEIKKRYDPTNFFRVNRNISPEADS